MPDPLSVLFPDSDLATAEKAAAKRNADAQAHATREIEKSVNSAGADLSITYREIEVLTERLRAHSAFVLEMAANVAKVATDGDFLESAVLSPLSAATTTTTVVAAAGALTLYIVRADAIALITVGIVSVYQAADAALNVTAASLGGAGTIVDAAATGVYETGEARINMLPGAVIGITVGLYATGVVLASARASIEGEAVRNLVLSVRQAAEDSAGDPMAFIFAVPNRVGENFSITNRMVERLWQNFLLRTETGLGGLGGAYPSVIAALLATGSNWGVFKIIHAEVATSSSRQDSARIRLRSSARIYRALFGVLPPGTDPSKLSTFDSRFREDGTLLPNSVSTLLASAAQIDILGGQEEAAIRIIKSTGPDGQTRFTVQIPSTMSWDATSGKIPNNVTSDLSLLADGDQSVIAIAVYDAMKLAGIQPRDPVQLVGFSLGGIAAAAIATGSNNYNIEQIVTAGAPTGRFPVGTGGNHTKVIALEALEDPVPIAEGQSLKEKDNWTVIRDHSKYLLDEKNQEPFVLFKSHDALRYARMAEDHPEINNDPTVKKFLSGDLQVTDYYARGKQ